MASILHKHSQKQKQDNFLLVDVDEILNKLKNDDKEALKTEATSDKVTSEGLSNLTDRSKHLKENETSDYDASEFSRDQKDNSTSLVNQQRLGSSHLKGASLFGRNKKEMKEFMKKKLAKTRQSGNDGVFLVGKSLK